MPIVLTGDQDTELRRHAEAAYPGECCGALLGRTDQNGKSVVELIALDNRHEEGPERRFRIEADALFQVDQSARRKNLGVLGFYHSHPDAPARPSEYDREHAWTDYSYVIVSVEQGHSAAMSSWVLEDDRSRYSEESVEIV